MKTLIKFVLQRVPGFETYLYFSSLVIIRKLRRDRSEKDFLYFLSLLPEKGTVIDIGANLGVMSYYLARNHPRRRVIAFEPVAFNYRNLERIKRKFALSNLETHQIALGAEGGQTEMIIPVRKRVRFHALARVKKVSDGGQEKGEVFKCPMARLDQLFKNNQSRITGIKIAVENFEYSVLKGAEMLLVEHKPIIFCEIRENENRYNTLSFLQHRGYKTMVKKKNGLTEFDPELHQTWNFFFIPALK